MKTNIKSLFLLLIVVLSACHKKPQVENIHNICPMEFQLLKDSINIVLERIEGEKSKLVLKKYGKYKTQLKNLIEKTEELIQRNKENKVLEKLPEIDTDIESEV